jgi:hypothetical protein
MNIGTTQKQSDWYHRIASIDKMVVSKMKEFFTHIYKNKLGTKEDIAIVTELKKTYGCDFRIYANCGWMLRRQSITQLN